MRNAAAFFLLLLMTGSAHAAVKPQIHHESKVDYFARIWSPNDIDDALKLIAETKDLPDAAGQRCWKHWRPAAVVMENHPLPKQPTRASDLQVARLVKIAIDKLQVDVECKWLSDRIHEVWGLPGETAMSPKRTVGDRILSGAMGSP